MFSGLITILLVIIIWSIAGPLFAQDDKKSNEPKVEIKIKKEFDDKGNLIGYDSTYTWSWSGSSPLPHELDSMIEPHSFSFFEFDHNFNRDFFRKGFPFDDFDSPFKGFGQDFFNDPFWYESPLGDSLFWENFNHRFNFNFDMNEFFKNYNDMMEHHYKSIPAPSHDEKKPAEESEKIVLPPANKGQKKMYTI